MPKIAITILISLFLFGNMGLAQQINGDSIKSLLPGTPANTLLYAQRIQEISKYYRRINPDSAIYLADISLNIGLALNDHTIINTAKFLKANVLSDRHNQKEARALYDEALSEFKIANNQKMLMQTMNNYGATGCGSSLMYPYSPYLSIFFQNCPHLPSVQISPRSKSIC